MDYDGEVIDETSYDDNGTPDGTPVVSIGNEVGSVATPIQDMLLRKIQELETMLDAALIRDLKNFFAELLRATKDNPAPYLVEQQALLTAIKNELETKLNTDPTQLTQHLDYARDKFNGWLAENKLIEELVEGSYTQVRDLYEDHEIELKQYKNLRLGQVQNLYQCNKFIRPFDCVELGELAPRKPMRGKAYFELNAPPQGTIRILPSMNKMSTKTLEAIKISKEAELTDIKTKKIYLEEYIERLKKDLKAFDDKKFGFFNLDYYRDYYTQEYTQEKRKYQERPSPVEVKPETEVEEEVGKEKVKADTIGVQTVNTKTNDPTLVWRILQTGWQLLLTCGAFHNPLMYLIPFIREAAKETDFNLQSILLLLVANRVSCFFLANVLNFLMMIVCYLFVKVIDKKKRLLYIQKTEESYELVDRTVYPSLISTSDLYELAFQKTKMKKEMLALIQYGMLSFCHFRFTGNVDNRTIADIIRISATAGYLGLKLGGRRFPRINQFALVYHDLYFQYLLKTKNGSLPFVFDWFLKTTDAKTYFDSSSPIPFSVGKSQMLLLNELGEPVEIQKEKLLSHEIDADLSASNISKLINSKFQGSESDKLTLKAMQINSHEIFQLFKRKLLDMIIMDNATIYWQVDVLAFLEKVEGLDTDENLKEIFYQTLQRKSLLQLIDKSVLLNTKQEFNRTHDFGTDLISYPTRIGKKTALYLERLAPLQAALEEAFATTNPADKAKKVALLKHYPSLDNSAKTDWAVDENFKNDIKMSREELEGLQKVQASLSQDIEGYAKTLMQILKDKGMIEQLKALKVEDLKGALVRQPAGGASLGGGASTRKTKGNKRFKTKNKRKFKNFQSFLKNKRKSLKNASKIT